MNSYNENLRSTVVNTLQSQYLYKKNLKAQANAAMFTLYHAEGATITAEENLDAAKKTMNFKAAVKKQAVNNNNLAKNLLASATQANQYGKQAITNTAVCASNIQVANNSIIKLASDMSKIFSIIKAADYGSDIYQQAKTINELMGITAYAAEYASDTALKASSYAAEVSCQTVLDESKNTATLINNLLKVTATEFDDAAQIVAVDNIDLATVSANEKISEGVLEDVEVDFGAARTAYESINTELNLGLAVSRAGDSNTLINVDFNTIKNPFFTEITDHTDYPALSKLIRYSDVLYYVVLVKESKKATFSISDADNLLLKDNIATAMIMFEAFMDVPDTDHIKKQIDVTTANDSDGENINYGDKYVAFVVGIYSPAYKQQLNNYDNYLSAPSEAFTPNYKLKAAENISIADYDATDPIQQEKAITFKSLKDQATEADTLDKNISAVDYTNVVFFAPGADVDEHSVEYRCMFLPVINDQTNDLLTKGTLNSLIGFDINNIVNYEDSSSAISDLQNKLLEVDAELKLAEFDHQRKINDFTNPEHNFNKKTAAELSKEDKELKAQLKKAQDDAEANSKAIARKQTKLKQDLAKAQKNIAELILVKQPEFLFNLLIAEQVTFGNYSTGLPFSYGKYAAFVGPSTTDNFGNRLIDKTEYLVVILSIFNEIVTVNAPSVVRPTQAMYTNTLSAFTPITNFVYQKK